MTRKPLDRDRKLIEQGWYIYIDNSGGINYVGLFYCSGSRVLKGGAIFLGSEQEGIPVYFSNKVTQKMTRINNIRTFLSQLRSRTDWAEGLVSKLAEEAQKA